MGTTAYPILIEFLGEQTTPRTLIFNYKELPAPLLETALATFNNIIDRLDYRRDDQETNALIKTLAKAVTLHPDRVVFHVPSAGAVTIAHLHDDYRALHRHPVTQHTLVAKNNTPVIKGTTAPEEAASEVIQDIMDNLVEEEKL